MKCKYDTTFHLQHIIKQLIDNSLENWDNESSKITIESFKRKTDCLVIIHIGRWGEKHHHFKSALSLKLDFPHQIKKLKKLLHLMEHF